MRCRITVMLIILLVAVLSAGCVGSRETDEIAYVLAIGLDKSDEPGKICVTYQIAIPRALAGGPQSAGGKTDQTTALITIKATNLAEARNLLNAAVSRAPLLSHVKVFIIGDELARAGVADTIAPIMRFREFRGSIFVMVVNDDTAERWLRSNIPKLELLPSRYYESALLTATESSYYIKTHLHSFYAGLKTRGFSSYALLGGIQTEGISPAKKALPPSRSDEYIGNTPRWGKSENPAELLGTALFRSGKLIGKLTSDETRLLAIATNQFQRSFYVIDDPLEPKKAINIAIRPGEPTKVDVKLVNGQAVIKLDVFIEGEISALPSGINYESAEYRQLLEEQIRQSFQRNMLDMLLKLQYLHTDPIGFGYKCRRNFTTLQEWEDFDWDSAFRQAKFQLSVEVKIRRSGLMWRSSPYKPL